MLFRILRSVYAVYGVLVFLVHLLLFIPFLFLGLLIFGQRAIRPLIWYAHHGIAGVTLFLSGIWLRVKGRELVRHDGPFIIVSNHRSFLDILIDAVCFPGGYKFLSKKEMVKVPVFGVLVKRMCILVDRKDAESRHQSFENMKQALDDGFSVLLYPEGTRNRTPEVDRIKKYYDGAFRLASETGRPLAVITLNDPGRHNDPIRELDLWPGWINCQWDLITDTQGRGIEDLKAETRKIMMAQFVEEKLTVGQ
ncbi:MAG: lysophospholipid acyltransferase family protein [Bacteroidota bacterium]